jgi:hypothetical protein
MAQKMSVNNDNYRVLIEIKLKKFIKKKHITFITLKTIKDVRILTFKKFKGKIKKMLNL